MKSTIPFSLDFGCVVNSLRNFIVLSIILLLSGCGFHLAEPAQLAEPLYRMYLQTPDPYGYLARSLEQQLKLSHVKLMCQASDASTILSILKDETSQELLSVNGTQQTRQYTLRVTVVFEITDEKGRTLVPQQTLTETRSMTVQANQVLGSSNEANLFYYQMRQTLAYAIINRIASKEITDLINLKENKNSSCS